MDLVILKQDKNGNRLPDETYYYVVSSNNKIHKGWLKLADN